MQPIQEELLRGAQAGQEAAIAALIARLMPVIRKGARDNRAPGLEFEDAVQEGLIGLFGAVRSKKKKKGPFVPYAVACIAHAQQDARRAATRQKHAPLNDSVPLTEGEPAPGLPDPVEQAIANETCARVFERIDTLLSPLERAALLASLEGRTAAQTARALHRAPKTVENALARARRKLRDAR